MSPVPTPEYDVIFEFPKGNTVVNQPGSPLIELSIAAILINVGNGGSPTQPDPIAWARLPGLSASGPLTDLNTMVTVDLGASNADNLEGQLSRPGKSLEYVSTGTQFKLDAADQGGTITLSVVATKTGQNPQTRTAELAVPAAPAQLPSVTIPTEGGFKAGSSATITADGAIQITLTNTNMNSDELGVNHWLVQADNIEGKTVTVRRNLGSPVKRGGDANHWQAAYAYDPHGDDWRKFDTNVGSNGQMVSSLATPAERPTMFVARRPVFTMERWRQAIARWRANPLTRPTASSDSFFVAGTLPSNQFAPALPVYAFAFGLGSKAIVLTGNVHTDEHIGAYTMEAFIDFALSNDPHAVALRAECTFYCYPAMNPQGRHAGVSRVEPVTGRGTSQNPMNANRLFSTDYDHVPFSKVMRDIWIADLPNPIEANLDFHDAAIQTGRGMIYEENSGSFGGFLATDYITRTGVAVERNPSTVGPTSIGGWMMVNKNAAWRCTMEHYISDAVSIPEWKQWGRDAAMALRNHLVPGAEATWHRPVWVPWATGTTLSTVDGSTTSTNGVANGAGNTGMAFEIPANTTIELVVDAALVNIAALSIRHGSDATLSLAGGTGVDVHKQLNNPTKYQRRQQLTWGPDRSWAGIIGARNTNNSNDAVVTALNNTLYRIL